MGADTWRQRAREKIYPALRQGVMQGLKGRALRRYINTFYKEYDPLCLRKNFPYQVWVEELNAVMEGENLAPQLRLELTGNG